MLSWILVAGSLALGLLGFVDVYRATVNGGGAGTMNFAGALLGIGEIAAAAVIAILARIVQARSQHEELLAALEEPDRTDEAICPGCGRQCSSGDQFCTRCGAQLAVGGGAGS